MHCSPHLFPIHIIYALIFPNILGTQTPDTCRYKWVGKSLTCNKHVGFKALCNKQVEFKALVISKSFSSFLIGCVRRPTSRTDKGGSSISDNMITFNGIYVYNILSFKFKRCSLTKLLYVVKFNFQCIMYYLQLSDWRY